MRIRHWLLLHLFLPPKVTKCHILMSAVMSSTTASECSTSQKKMSLQFGAQT